jgi:hypothetical protein
MDLECRVHVELPVHALLRSPEVSSRIRHWEDLWPVYLVCLPIGHYGRRAAAEYVLQPIGTGAIGEGDEEAVIMLDRDDGRLVHAALLSPDMTHDRSV